MNTKRVSIESRFWSKVQRDAENICWLWCGAINQQGYGVIRKPGANSGNLLAHRYSYMLHIGEIPHKISVCHECDNPCCVNPQHLFLGTHIKNMRDSITKGRFAYPIKGIINRAKTHCKYGHQFSLANTYTHKKSGQRHCRECHRNIMRARRKSHKTQQL